MESEKVKPEIGMGATRLGYTDRDPYTVVKIYTDKKIEIQEDNYKRIDENGMSEDQEYEYAPNPLGRTVTLRLCKGGWQSKGGEQYSVGNRRKYHDYSF